MLVYTSGNSKPPLTGYSMGFALKTLNSSELNYWILDRLASLIDKYRDKDGLVVIRNDGHLVYQNDVSRRLLGTGVEEKLGFVARAVLSGDRVDHVSLGHGACRIVASATHLNRGDTIVAAVIWLAELDG